MTPQHRLHQPDHGTPSERADRPSRIGIASARRYTAAWSLTLVSMVVSRISIPPVDRAPRTELASSSSSHVTRPSPTNVAAGTVLDSELARVRTLWNTVRLLEAVGYVTPDDEHHGRGPRIRRARTAGMKQARRGRIDYNRNHPPEHHT